MARVAEIESVEEHDHAWEIKYDGWTFFGVTKEMLPEAPKVGDRVLYETKSGSLVTFLNINGKTLIYKTDEDLKRERLERIAENRRRHEEEFAKNRDKWFAQVEALEPELKARMDRFTAVEGDEFWIESGGYELYCVGGADALLKHVRWQFPDSTEDQLTWIGWWADLNTEKYGYDYKRQMEILPNFGDGHSGFTYSAAVSMAKAVVRGEEV